MWNIQDSVLYRDALILIINKPAGLAVHKSGKFKGKTLTNYLPELCFGLPKLPQLAHRLDRLTSGCLVLGRHKQALIKLEKLFQNSEVQKSYLALVHGKPREESGVVDVPLAKLSQSHSQWKMRVDHTGKSARTSYNVVASNAEVSLLELVPHTGRTHQLRVHMQHLGCPIIGDALYSQQKTSRHMMLHAYSIGLKLYPKKPNIVAHAPIPQYFIEYCAQHNINIISDAIYSLNAELPGKS